MEYHNLSCDSEILFGVAARIIQHYWRLFVSSRSGRQDAKALLLGDGGKLLSLNTNKYRGNETVQMQQHSTLKPGLQKPPKPRKRTALGHSRDCIRNNGSGICNKHPANDVKLSVAISNCKEDEEAAITPHVEDSAEHVDDSQKVHLNEGKSEHISIQKMRASTNASRMESILRFLDDLELQVV